MPDAPNRPSVDPGKAAIVAPQPVPMTFNVTTMRLDETQQAVVLVFHSPTGQHVTFRDRINRTYRKDRRAHLDAYREAVRLLGASTPHGGHQ